MEKIKKNWLQKNRYKGEEKASYRNLIGKKKNLYEFVRKITK